MLFPVNNSCYCISPDKCLLCGNIKAGIYNYFWPFFVRDSLKLLIVAYDVCFIPVCGKQNWLDLKIDLHWPLLYLWYDSYCIPVLRALLYPSYDPYSTPLLRPLRYPFDTTPTVPLCYDPIVPLCYDPYGTPLLRPLKSPSVTTLQNPSLTTTTKPLFCDPYETPL